MKKILIEDAIRQNWKTYFVLYQNGHSAIENYHTRTKKTTRVYFNVKTTNKFNAYVIKEPMWEIVSGNKITDWLIKLGIVKIRLTMKEDNGEE